MDGHKIQEGFLGIMLVSLVIIINRIKVRGQVFFFVCFFTYRKRYNYLLCGNIRYPLLDLINYHLSFLFPLEPRGFVVVVVFKNIEMVFERSKDSCAKFSITSMEVITAFLSTWEKGGSWRAEEFSVLYRQALHQSESKNKNIRL